MTFFSPSLFELDVGISKLSRRSSEGLSHQPGVDLYPSVIIKGTETKSESIEISVLSMSPLSKPSTTTRVNLRSRFTGR